MAAEIRTASKPSGVRFSTYEKPVLIGKIDGFSYDVNGIAILGGDDDGIITVSDDKSIRVWLRRMTGQYWPSVHQLLPSGATSIDYHWDQKLVFVGQENGTVSQFSLSSDNNQIQLSRDYLSHVAVVTAVFYSPENSWILSVSRDKTFACYCTQTSRKVSDIMLDSWCTALTFDNQTKHAFVGEYSGKITLLKLGQNGLHVVTTMSGHSAMITSLSWHIERQLLFSGAADNMIIVWDIGGRKGTVYELQGHQNKVRSVKFIKRSNELVSAGEDGVIVFWDMNKERIETPSWIDSDVCQLCAKPFFWNFKGMVDQKLLGSRQHHCRHCGKAVCDRCSSMALTIPQMGFEMMVRVCEKCYKILQNTERKSLATFHDVKHSVTTMAINEQKKRLVTAGYDRTIKIWDISDVMKK